MDLTTDWGEVARLRQGLYRFHAAAFLTPSAERLELLRAAADYLDTLGVDRFPFASVWAAFVSELGGADDVVELAGEHIRLFGSGTDGVLCPATESFYVASAEGGGIASFLSRLGREYQALGVQIDGRAVDGPDHISAELETMADLCRREAEAAESEDTAAIELLLVMQDQFLARHPAAWFPAFAQRVEGAAPLTFYQSLVRATGAFLAHDQSLVQGLGRYVRT